MEGRNKRGEERGGGEKRKKKEKEEKGDILAGIFTRSRARCTPTQKSLLVESHVSVRACLRVKRVCVRVCVCTHVYTCVKRDVATQAGMQFRNARVAHEASPALLFPIALSASRPLLVTGRNEGQGGDGYQEGTRWNSLRDFFSIFVRRILSPRVLSSAVPIACPPLHPGKALFCSRHRRVFLPPVGNYLPLIHCISTMRACVPHQYITRRRGHESIKIILPAQYRQVTGCASLYPRR